METVAMEHFFNLKGTPYRLKRKGVSVKVINGERCQMQFAKLEPGFVSDHDHPEEQMGYVIAGTLRLSVEGESKTCVAGEGYHIPAGARHSFEVTSEEPAEIVDVFSPPKKVRE
jgi:quercetin dioxygenase-like cupin family protein